jgi:hypothetical protein
MRQMEKKVFADIQSGRLNSDDSPFVVGTNEWVNMENCRTGSTDLGETGVVESIGSNVLISVPQPSVNFITIGSVEDIENSRICYFKFNTTGLGHKIVCFYTDTNTEYDVLLSSQVTGGLNFSKQTVIHSAQIVNGLLYWVEGTVNQPRKINIEAGIKANNPSFVTTEVAYTFPLNFSEITIIKPCAIYPPTIAKGYDSIYYANLIENTSFQFAYQYVYYDGEKSVVSAYSVASRINQDGSTLNYILVSMNATERIPTSVKIVNLIFRINNTNFAFIAKSWNKDNPTSAIEINEHNAGLFLLRHYFYNNNNYEAIAEDDTLRPFDNVPIYSQALSAAKNRIFLGNNTEGYNTPQKTSMAISQTLFTPSTLPLYQSFAAGQYQTGIVFYDFAMRKCGVVTNEYLVSVVNERSYVYTNAVSSITWTLNNLTPLTEIPDWAYYYAPVRTLNNKTRNYIESFCNTLKYATKTATGDYDFVATSFTNNAVGIAIDTSALVQTKLGYVFTQGDMCRIVTQGSVVYSLPVIGQYGNYIILKPVDIGSVVGLRIIYNIYTPYGSNTQEPFYEVGQMYKVNNPTTSVRSYSTLSGSFAADSYILARQFKPFPVISYYASAMSPNDNLYQNWFNDAGKINLITLLGQSVKDRYVSWSDTYIPNTNVNGLSTFRALNQTNVPDDSGSITKLQLTSKIQNEGSVMLAICKAETNSLYLGEVQITDSTGATQFFSSSQNVIGTINELKGNYGCINPESVCQYRGNVYFFDATNGRWIQYSANGLDDISSYKMTRFWRYWAKKYLSLTYSQIEALGDRPFVFAAVDSAHNELLISIPKLSNTPPKGYLPDYPSTVYPFDILDYRGKTIVYKIGIGTEIPHWQGAMTFTTEYFCTIQNRLFSFRNGHLYEHNQTTSQNNFYGVQYTSKIMATSNMFPQVPKVYDNILSESNISPIFVYLYNQYPYQQSSDLLDSDFSDVEGLWYASILRNKLVPTSDGFNTDGLLTGEVMRNVNMMFMVEYSPTTKPLQLRFIQISFATSRGHIV